MKEKKMTSNLTQVYDVQDQVNAELENKKGRWDVLNHSYWLARLMEELRKSRARDYQADNLPPDVLKQQQDSYVRKAEENSPIKNLSYLHRIAMTRANENLKPSLTKARDIIEAVLVQIDGADINGRLLAALKLIECGEFCGKPMKVVTMKCIARAAIANAEKIEPSDCPVCAEAYQLVGVYSEIIPEAEKWLDNLSQNKLVHTDLLPVKIVPRKDYKAILLALIGSLTLADHMGDASTDIDEALDQIGMKIEYEDLGDLGTILGRDHGVKTLHGTDLYDVDDLLDDPTPNGTDEGARG